MLAYQQKESTARVSSIFFFNDTATTEIYTTANTLSLHDALPISHVHVRRAPHGGAGIVREPGEIGRAHV